MEDTSENLIICSSATPRNPYLAKRDKLIMYKGYVFTHRYLTAKHNSYRCKHFKRFNCTAKFSITLTKYQITVSGDHNVHCKFNNGNKNTIELTMITTSEVEDT